MGKRGLGSLFRHKTLLTMLCDRPREFIAKARLLAEGETVIVAAPESAETAPETCVAREADAGRHCRRLP